jgi:hypothetical protein
MRNNGKSITHVEIKKNRRKRKVLHKHTHTCDYYVTERENTYRRSRAKQENNAERKRLACIISKRLL